MRVAVLGRWIETDLRQGGAYAFPALAVVKLRVLNRQPFFDDLADGQTRRERTVGILEDDLHFLAERTHLLVRQAVDAVADVSNRSLGGKKTQNGEAER